MPCDKRAAPSSTQSEVTVKCLRPIKYHMRFDSQVTSTWATFTYDAASQEPKEVKLSF